MDIHSPGLGQILTEAAIKGNTMSQTMLQEREQQYRLKAQRDLQLDYGFSSADQPSEKWQRHLTNAKISWEKLTEQELIKSEGSAKKLAGLVQQRYAVSHRDAEQQVNAFLKKNTININQGSERNYE